MRNRLETSLMPKGKLVEITPYGVTAGYDPGRPVMLFKEKKGELILPVWLSPLDVGIAISQHHVKMSSISPHDLSSRLIKSLGIRVEKCVFVSVKSGQQMVELYLEGHPELKKISSRADQCISFCLHEKAKFYCTRSYIQECRDLDAEMLGVAEGVRMVPGVLDNQHPYLM